MKKVIRTGYWLYVTMFVVGVCLLAINVYGLFIPLRAPELSETTYAPTITAEEFFAQDDRREGETDAEFIMRMADLVGKQIAHHWPTWDTEAIADYRIQIPIWENFILYLRSISDPERYLEYEYCTYEKAVERGLGLCSQKAIIFSAIMNRNGITSRPMGLSGHVIATVHSTNLESEEWLVDADFGFVAKHSLESAVADNELMRPYYEQSGLQPHEIDNYVRFYNRDGNAPYDEEFLRQSCKNEAEAYRDKWLIPILLVLPLLCIELVCYLRKRDIRHLIE